MTMTQMAFGPIRDLPDKIKIFGFEAVAEENLPDSTSYHFHLDDDMNHDIELKVCSTGYMYIYRGEDMIQCDFVLTTQEQIDDYIKKAIYRMKKEIAKIVLDDKEMVQREKVQEELPDFITIRSKKCHLQGHLFNDGHYYVYKDKKHNVEYNIIVEVDGMVVVRWYDMGKQRWEETSWMPHETSCLEESLQHAAYFVSARAGE